MRFLLYKEKIMLLISSLVLIALLVITIYFSMNNEQFDNTGKIAVLTSEEFNEDVEKVSRNNNVTIYSQKDHTNPNTLVKKLEEIYHEYSCYIIVLDKEHIPLIAAYLAFMIENLTKPIILTQKQHLAGIVKKIPSIAIQEVIVTNGNQLFRGVTTVLGKEGKLLSYKYPELNHLNSLEFPKEPLGFKYIDPKITVKFGNEKADANILTVNQIPKKGEDKIFIVLSEKRIDKIPTFDMTREAAYTKLVFLLSNVKDKNIIHQLLNVNFRGEIIN